MKIFTNCTYEWCYVGFCKNTGCKLNIPEKNKTENAFQPQDEEYKWHDLQKLLSNYQSRTAKQLISNCFLTCMNPCRQVYTNMDKSELARISLDQKDNF